MTFYLLMINKRDNDDTTDLYSLFHSIRGVLCYVNGVLLDIPCNRRICPSVCDKYGYPEWAIHVKPDESLGMVTKQLKIKHDKKIDLKLITSKGIKHVSTNTTEG